MNSSDARLMELALKKQRLQFDSEAARSRLQHSARILPPLFQAMDGVAAGVRWIKRRPEIPVAIGAALLVMRPRRLWTWARRSFALWQVWRRARSLLVPRTGT